jgi:hypothetical protein
MKCIKIKTFDERVYYTNINNIEKIKKIKFLIKNKKIIIYKNYNLLKIKTLIKAICSETLIQKNTINKSLSEEIKKFIQNSFEKNRKLNFLDLKNKFSKYNIKNINLYNHLNQIKKIYKKLGKEIKRTKTGVFELD